MGLNLKFNWLKLKAQIQTWEQRKNMLKVDSSSSQIGISYLTVYKKQLCESQEFEQEKRFI